VTGRHSANEDAERQAPHSVASRTWCWTRSTGAPHVILIPRAFSSSITSSAAKPGALTDSRARLSTRPAFLSWSRSIGGSGQLAPRKPMSAWRKHRSFPDRVAKRSKRPFAALQVRPSERAGRTRKRTLA